MGDTAQFHKYSTVYNAIRDNILMKVYPSNSLLPTETHLMEQFDVSRNTIRRALKQLQEDGYISTRRGSGSLVLDISKFQKAMPGSASWKSTKAFVEYYVPYKKINRSPDVIDMVVPPAEVSEAFGIDPNVPVLRCQIIRTIDGIPYNYSIQYINTVLLPDYPKHTKEFNKPQHILANCLGLHSVRATEHILCRNAGFVEANLLNVEVGTALCYTYRIGECEKGIYEYAIFYNNPTYTGYQIVIESQNTEDYPSLKVNPEQ